MPTNQHFQKEEGIDALRCVLLAYSERNKILGYCQSMNFIAAILLLHMECDDVFWCLAAIVEDILPKNWFDGELHGSLVEPMVLESCVRWKLPKLYEHLYNLDVKVFVAHLSSFHRHENEYVVFKVLRCKFCLIVTFSC